MIFELINRAKYWCPLFSMFCNRISMEMLWPKLLLSNRVEILLIPCLGLAFAVNHEFSFFEVTWTFSLYLESVAMLPQMWMIRKSREVEIFTSHYLILMGLYRALYIANWIYRYYNEGFYDLVAIAAGTVQTLLYILFLALCCFTGVKPVQYQLLEVWRSLPGLHWPDSI